MHDFREKTGSQPRDDNTASTRTERHPHQKAQPDNSQDQPNPTRTQTNQTTDSLTTRSAEPAPTPHLSATRVTRPVELCFHTAPLCLPRRISLPLCHTSRQGVASSAHDIRFGVIKSLQLRESTEQRNKKTTGATRLLKRILEQNKLFLKLL